MLYSMTGYGKASAPVSNKKISIEIKTLNSKSQDIYTKIPNQYKEIELPIRQIIAEQLTRGKIDVLFTVESLDNSTPTQINKELAKAYFEDIQLTNEVIQQENIDYLSLILRMPDIFITSDVGLTDEEKDQIYSLVKTTCEEVNLFRRQEGEALEKDFTNYIETIRSLAEEVTKYEEERIDGVKQRLLKGLEEIGTYDEVRYHQELVYYIEKLDISEEKMRLANHLDYFLTTMKEESSGKKLGFIAQEIGREINTMGSKCSHSEIQRLVVNMKDVLEKIKEQVLNTL